MLKWIVLAVFFVRFVSTGAELASAQATSPKVEIYGGLTKLWGHANGANFDDGGVDVKIWRILWLRPIQAEYLRESFPADPNEFPPAREHNRRLSAGFVIRFGTLKWR